ncbi:GntR family transcriptional regulator [Microbacterium sp. NPDC055910]|uniref:GntR family transcriptional regulator n=1 Tax=Microbacterium sp. NPDC055910 TaxID=3345659 RepID=UPI0035E25D97
MTGKNLADRAFEEIERLIVLQQIAPGSLVSEKQLMELTGIGRTPVREALQRLARDRMVEIHPQRGVLVPSSSVEAQLKLLELRRQLEPFSARLAAARATKAQRQRAEELARRATVMAPTELESFPGFLREAHELIVSAAHNEFLSVAMAPLQGLSRRFWFSHVKDPDAELARAGALHAAILAAIAAHDEDAAVAASIDLNDYLIAFTYATLPTRSI